MGSSNLFFESVFKRKLSGAGTQAHLTEITNEYPYFSAAQFYLLLLVEKETAEYQQQARKTSVLFNNPYWLQFQLQEKQTGAIEISDDSVGDDDRFVIAAGQSNESQTDEANEALDNSKTNNADHHAVKEINEESETVTLVKEPATREPQETFISIIAEKEIAPILDETIILPNGITTEEAITEIPAQPVNEISDLENNMDGNVAANEMVPTFSEPAILSQSEKDNDIITEIESRPVEESPISTIPESGAEEMDNLPSPHFNNENSPLVNEAGVEDEDDGPVEEEGIEPMHFKLNIDTTATTEDKIIFEPLHTSDYFASLGIKLGSEIVSTDRLGTHLKSFTEWLKTMKKIHHDELPQQSGQEDLSIQKLAEQSNKKDEVVTEAMADVLLHQGKAGKAIEVYKKLSLLNPSKRAYFAAKIDQLKEH